MNDLLSYSGINTKVRAMKSKLIDNEEFNKIANLDLVVDFISFLKEHPGYREIFSHYDEHDLHRGDVERIISNALYLDYAKIYRFADAFQRNDLALIFLRYEINILKTCIRLVYNKENSFDLSYFKDFFEKHSHMNLVTLSTCKSMEEYINALRGTEYYTIFETLQNSSSPASSFDYEMQLDLYYYKKVWKMKDKVLTGDTLKAFTISLGTEIDLLNIMWIYRAKAVYDLSQAEILSIIIPISYRLSKEQLAKMAASATLEEYMSILKNVHYRHMYHALTNGTMEVTYRNWMSKIYKSNEAKYPNSMATANAYLYHREMETSLLTTALECIRYRLDSKDKLKFMMQ